MSHLSGEWRLIPPHLGGQWPNAGPHAQPFAPSPERLHALPSRQLHGPLGQALFLLGQALFAFGRFARQPLGGQPLLLGAPGETARNVVESGLNTATQTFQRVTDQFTKVLGFSGPQAEEVARRSSENILAVTQASTVLARGAQEVSQEVFGLVQDRLTKNVEAVNRIVGTRSVQDFVAVQSELARDSLQQVIDTNRRIAEVSLRIADEAGRIIQAQADKNAKQVRRVA